MNRDTKHNGGWKCEKKGKEKDQNTETETRIETGSRRERKEVEFKTTGR
jgi:hypothetical protein